MRLIPLKKKYYTGVQIRDVIDEVCTNPEDVLEILSRFAAIKTDDVEPIRHGEWIKHEDGACACNVCGLGLETFVEGIFYNYCPFCGAKMRKEENKDDE